MVPTLESTLTVNTVKKHNTILKKNYKYLINFLLLLYFYTILIECWVPSSGEVFKLQTNDEPWELIPLCP